MSMHQPLDIPCCGRRRRGWSAGIRMVIALALVVAGVPGLALGPLSPSTAQAKQEGGGKGNSGNSGVASGATGVTPAVPLAARKTEVADTAPVRPTAKAIPPRVAPGPRSATPEPLDPRR